MSDGVLSTLRVMAACPHCGEENPTRARFCNACGSPLAERSSEVGETRRTVTVLFSDVVGSTALGEQLDPETLRGVMSRYFTAMSTVIERHGGTVEKFIGDAIMTVFGLPTIREDDALRAVRAASEMRDELTALNAQLVAEHGVSIETRTGIHTGEVVAGDPTARQTLVTGDAVNTAARLEQAAGAGEILIGLPTWRLVRGAVTVGASEEVLAKGKADPVTAFRLLSVATRTSARAQSVPARLFGRQGELERLVGRFDSLVTDRQPNVVTVIGAAGVGKSRLVAEFISMVADRAGVLRGRCLSYGEGITYWPIREILHAAAGIVETDDAEAGRRKLEALLGGLSEGRVIAEKLASAIGLTEEAASTEEIFWATRRALGHLAVTRPLVVVVEDIHWAQPTLLQLIQHVVDQVRDAPVLILCPARPELLETSPSWVDGRANALTINLDGLTAEAADRLLDSLSGGRGILEPLRGRVLATAEGNPLFIEEMVQMLAEEELTADIVVPPTIQALLAARLDRLPPAERSVAQRGSVAGRVFEEDAVAALTPEGSRIDVIPSLVALVQKEVLCPEMAELTASEAFKFRHILIRDAAYEALSKSDRGELHEAFADWLERTAGSRQMEYQEILGHHLEQAFRYRTDLRKGGDRTEAVGRRAAGHLRAAAKRARDRGDPAAAVQLYGKAEGLPVDGLRASAELALESGLAFLDMNDLAQARLRADAALRLAGDADDPGLAARARLLRLDVRASDGTYLSADPAIEVEVDTALDDAQASGDRLALAQAWQAESTKAWNAGRFAESSDRMRRSLGFAREVGDARYELDTEGIILVEALSGPTKASEVVANAESVFERAISYPTVRGEVLRILAVAEAMLGRFDDARAHAHQSIVLLEELSQTSAALTARGDWAWVERLAGDHAASETILRELLAASQAVGDPSLVSFAAARLGQALVAQGRLAEAAEYLAEGGRNPVATNRSRVAGGQARIHAAQGDRSAITEVDEMLAMVDPAFVNLAIDAHVDAAEAFAALGERIPAVEHARQALRLAESKENLAFVRQIRLLVSRLTDEGS